MRRYQVSLVLAVGGVGEARADILLAQFGEVREYFRVGHAARQPAQPIGLGDALAPDARLAAPFARFEGDDALIVHCMDPAIRCGLAKSLPASCIFPCQAAPAHDRHLNGWKLKMSCTPVRKVNV